MKKGWGIWLVVAVLAWFVYATKAILMPFLVGLAVAYLLDPVADKLEERKVPRWLATAIVLVFFFLVVIGIFIGILPLVKGQFSAFADNFPDYVAALRPLFDDVVKWVSETLNLGGGLTGEGVLESAGQTILSKAGNLFDAFWSGGMALFNILSLLLITPVVAFFLLRDWDILVAKVEALLPKKNAKEIKIVVADIDYALGGFVRGQTLSAIVMAILYATGWSIAGLQYALVLGLIGGVMAYIPFAGALFTLFLAMLIGIGQFGLDPWPLFKVALVYGVVQTLEAAVLTPNLIGSRVRLHPVWVLFAIFAGGEIMGFTGVLLAIPIAAVTGVLARYFVQQYINAQTPKKKAKAAAK